MKISQSRETVESITLTSVTVTTVTKNKLMSLVYPGEYLRTKKGVTYLYQDDPDWRHGSVSEIVVREATQLDKAVFILLEELRKEYETKTKIR